VLLSRTLTERRSQLVRYGFLMAFWMVLNQKAIDTFGSIVYNSSNRTRRASGYPDGASKRNRAEPLKSQD